MARFTMGLDAEFALESRRGTLVPAHDYLPGTTARFGTDGNSTIGEVRPNPGETPIELVTNLKSTLQRGVTRHLRMNKHRMVANGYRHGYALGAHIHFGHAKFLDTRTDRRSYMSDPVRAENMNQAGALLDAFVLPFATLFGDDRNEHRRRASAGYGRPSDVRVQPHGMEYRSCSSFIASPAVTLGVLTVAAVVMNEYLEGRVTTPGTGYKLHVNDFMSDPHTESNRNLRQKMTWLMQTRTARENKQYREIMAVMFQMVANGNYEQVEDMKKAWKLRYTEPVSARTMTEAEAFAFSEVR